MEKKESRFSWKHSEPGPNASARYGGETLNGEDDFMLLNDPQPAEGAKTQPNAAAESAKGGAPSYIPRREESYITADVVINGSVTSKSSIMIDGTVIGDVTSENDVIVCGSVQGNISAGSVKISSAKIKGDIISHSSVSLVKDSFIEGNISGKTIEVNGRVAGNLTAQEGAVIMGSAEINGDISAAGISVIEGAVLNGNIKIAKRARSAAEATEKEAAAAADEKLLSRYI